MENAADDYDSADPGLGDEFLAAVEHAVGYITDEPHRWQRIDETHHRFVLRRFPFNIYYRFDDNEIYVVAVAHQKRRPMYWARRR